MGGPADVKSIAMRCFGRAGHWLARRFQLFNFLEALSKLSYKAHRARAAGRAFGKRDGRT